MKHPLCLITLIMCCFLSGCSDQAKDVKIDQLRIAVLPDQSSERLKNRFGPLVDYLSEEIGIPCNLVIVENYLDLISRFIAGEIDVARFGGFTFLRANVAKGAVPLVMRDIDARFVSVFIVSGNSTANSIKELKDQRISFGSKLSTSGHLMPRYFLDQQGIKPEEFFSDVLYSGAHDRTVKWVKTERVDVGVANAVVVNQMIKQGDITQKDIRILSTSPPYADYVWAVQPDMPKTIRDKLMEAFLKLSPTDPTHNKLLNQLQAQSYFPANQNDFAALKSIASKLKLLNGE